MSGCCKNELTLKKLCAEQICVDNIQIENPICYAELSSQKVCSKDAISETLSAQKACVGSLGAKDICAININATNAGVSNLVANNACISGNLRAANFQPCGKYRAAITFSADTSYVLGSAVNWNTVLDDPNSNVSLGPTLYTVPLSGYYLVTIQIDQHDLIPASGNPILGTPVVLIELLINGVVSRQAFVPYLSFTSEQNSLLTAMILANAGDKLSSDFKVLAVDPVLGLIPVAGSVTIDADGSSLKSLFTVHLLSVTCTDMPCAPSVPCVPCVPSTCVPCAPAAGATSNPCAPCQL